MQTGQSLVTDKTCIDDERSWVNQVSRFLVGNLAMSISVYPVKSGTLLTLLLVGGGGESAPRWFSDMYQKTACASAMKLGDFS